MAQTAEQALLEQLEESIDSSAPSEQQEVALIDQFIEMHASVYQLPDEAYDRLLTKLLLNRINNAAWQYEQASKQHLLRVLQCIRILQREERLSLVLLQEQGLQYLCQKLHEITSSGNMVNNNNTSAANTDTNDSSQNKHRRVGSSASNLTTLQFQKTTSQMLQNATAQDANQQSGPVPTLSEEQCEVLTEILSILYKTVNRLGQDKAEMVYEIVLAEDVLNDLQLLLGVRHNVLLRCSFESILTLFEWVERQSAIRQHQADQGEQVQTSAKVIENLAIYFANSFTVDMLLQIIETFSDDFRKLAAETLTYMLRNERQAGDVLRLFKQLGGSEKLIGLITSTQSVSVRARLLVCFQTITSGEDQDILAELKDLNLVPILLQLVVAIRSPENETFSAQETPGLLGSILTTLTNLSLNDANNVKIRLHGAHIIGQLLMDNCPALNKENPKVYIEGNAGENLKVMHEMQMHCLRCLRFLYSVEKNRKAFKVIFPPNLFGAFIDVGNYNKDFQAYIPLLKKLNKKTNEEGLRQIRSNFEQMGNFQKMAGEGKDKFIGGFKVMDLIGKGAYGSVYLVQRGENQYAMKEIPLAHFDVSPEKFEQYLAAQNEETGEQRKSVDDVIVEDICKEVAILKDLGHPNIIRYYNSFADSCSVYIIMELLDGYSLGDYILSQSEKRHRVKESTVWSIFVQLCAALRYLHVEKRIVHRDLAPGNVLIDAEFNLKLADFGLAKRWGTQSASVMKSFVGTILYSCPEIVQSQPYTEKADIWSLGCIIYELMTFTQPFSAGNPLTVAKKIVDGEYEPIDEAHYSPLLIQTVRACMTADPQQRPNVLELCQLMVPVVMDQLDTLRTSSQASQQEIKHLKDRVRVFDQTSTTQFGFGGGVQTFKQTYTAAQGNTTGGFKQGANRVSANEQANATGNTDQLSSDMKLVQVNSEKLKKVSNDPVAVFLDTVNQLEFIIALPPTLDKDIRQIRVENFHRAIFNKNTNGAFIKNEILKLQNGSREPLSVSSYNSCLKSETYESMLHTVEDLLREHRFAATQQQ